MCTTETKMSVDVSFPLVVLRPPRGLEAQHVAEKGMHTQDNQPVSANDELPKRAILSFLHKAVFFSLGNPDTLLKHNLIEVALARETL